jgi:hypothetical protein
MVTGACGATVISVGAGPKFRLGQLALNRLVGGGSVIPLSLEQASTPAVEKAAITAGIRNRVKKGRIYLKTIDCGG